jgi:hypothetical protein
MYCLEKETKKLLTDWVWFMSNNIYSNFNSNLLIR